MGWKAIGHVWVYFAVLLMNLEDSKALFNDSAGQFYVNGIFEYINASHGLNERYLNLKQLTKLMDDLRIAPGTYISNDTTCLSSKQLLKKYEFDGRHVSQDEFIEMCPAFIYQQLLQPCKLSHSRAHVDSVDTESFYYGTAAVAVLSFIPFVLFLTIPKEKSKIYPHANNLLLALATSTLVSDAVLHLIPEALGVELAPYRDGFRNIREMPDSMVKLLTVLAAIYAMYLFSMTMGIRERVKAENKKEAEEQAANTQSQEMLNETERHHHRGLSRRNGLFSWATEIYNTDNAERRDTHRVNSAQVSNKPEQPNNPVRVGRRLNKDVKLLKPALTIAGDEIILKNELSITKDTDPKKIAAFKKQYANIASEIFSPQKSDKSPDDTAGTSKQVGVINFRRGSSATTSNDNINDTSDHEHSNKRFLHREDSSQLQTSLLAPEEVRTKKNNDSRSTGKNIIAGVGFRSAGSKNSVLSTVTDVDEEQGEPHIHKVGNYSGGGFFKGMSRAMKIFKLECIPKQDFGWVIIFTDLAHNTVDGIAVGAAFALNPINGVSTTVAVSFHEIPHELGDFAALMASGITWRGALFWNLILSISCFVGLYIGLAVAAAPAAAKWVYAISAGIFIYHALAEFLSYLQNIETEFWILFLLQNCGILLGFGIMFILTVFRFQLKETLENYF